MEAKEKIPYNDMENENKKQPDNKRIESTEGNSNKRRNVISGIIKWVIILVILVIVYFWHIKILLCQIFLIILIIIKHF